MSMENLQLAEAMAEQPFMPATVEFVPEPYTEETDIRIPMDGSSFAARTAIGLTEQLPFGGDQMVPATELPGDGSVLPIEAKSLVATFPGTPQQDAIPYD